MNLFLKIISKKYYFFAALILVIYIIFGVVFFYIRTVPFAGHENDLVSNMIESQQLFTRNFEPPVYGAGIGTIFAIRFFNFMVSDTFQAVKLASLASGFVYLLFSLVVVKKLFSSVISLATGLLLVINPYVLVYSSAVLSDMLAAALVMLALGVLFDNYKPRIFFLSGLLIGLAWCVRNASIAFLPVILGLSIFSGKNKLYTFRMLLFSVSGLIIGALPQLATNVLYHGKILYTENWRNTVAIVHGWEYASKVNSLSEGLVGGWIVLFKLAAKNLFYVIPNYLARTGYLPILFSFPGYILSLRNSNKKYLLIFCGISISLYLLGLSLVWRIENRYFLFILPLILSFSIYFFKVLTVKNEKLFIFIIATAVIISVFLSIKKIDQYIGSQQYSFKEVGLFLRDRAKKEDEIIASLHQVHFYAQKHNGKVLFEALDEEEIKNFPQAVEALSIDWIVFDEYRALKKFPNLNWLLNPNSDKANKLGWRLVYNVTEPYRTLVWQVDRR